MFGEQFEQLYQCEPSRQEELQTSLNGDEVEGVKIGFEYLIT